MIALISQMAYAGDVTVASGDTDFQKDNELYLSIKNTEVGGKDWRLVSAGTSGSIGVGKFSIYDALAGQSRLTIDGGNVGIGTTNPGSNKLDVAGNIHSTGDVCTDAGGGKCLSSAGGGASAAGWTDDGANVRLTTSTDKVGIGTSTPGSELEVSGQLKISSSINDKIVLAGTQANPHTIYLDNSKGIRFWDNVNNEIFRVTNTGDVSWSGSLTSGSVPWPRVTGFTGDVTSDNIADDGVISDGEASDVLTINNGLLYAPTSGNVGIGTTSPSQKLDVAGQIHATADICTDAGGGKCLSSAGSGGGVPSGAIMMFESSCPSGWTRFAALDGRFPRGSASAGATGGSSTHSHTYSTVISHTHNIDPPATSSGWVSSDHSHSFSGSTNTAGRHSHGLPRATSSDNDNYIAPDGSNYNNLPSNTFEAGDHGHSFSGGTGGQSANHFHTTDIGAFSSSSTGSGSGSTSTDSSLPPYYDIIFCRKD